MCTSSTIAIIISAISLLVSLWALWYTRKQYLSPIRPEVYINYYRKDPIEREVIFCIQNRSENIATILDVTPKTKNIVLTQPITRYELTNVETKAYFVYCKYVGTNLEDDVFRLKIKYADKEKNKYCAILYAGKGSLYIE